MPLERLPRNYFYRQLLELQESGSAYRVCYHKPPTPHIWCGSIFWTEADLINAYNLNADTYVTSVQYINTFCPNCKTYFPGERPQRKLDKWGDGWNEYAVRKVQSY